jgi:hypothetical protein
MLERLENSFDAQKYFVSNISHEPTPLAAITAELELASEKELTKGIPANHKSCFGRRPQYEALIRQPDGSGQGQLRSE